jgi:hypothetical protein
MFDPFYLDGVAPPQGFGKGFLMEFSGQPSFLTSGEMWASIDSGETQTLAAWKDGYVLRENPDGSMTAEPKFTSGIPPLTLRRVPTMGAETKVFNAETQEIPSVKELLAKGHTIITMFEIKDSATDITYPSGGKIVKIGGHDGTYYTGSNYDPSTGDQIKSYGTVIRFRPADGYVAYTNEGKIGKEGDIEAMGKTIEDFPFTFKISKIVHTATKKEYIPTETVEEEKQNRDDENDTNGDNGDNGDTNGDNGEEKGTNWMLWGGIAAVIGVIFVL